MLPTTPSRSVCSPCPSRARLVPRGLPILLAGLSVVLFGCSVQAQGGDGQAVPTAKAALGDTVVLGVGESLELEGNPPPRVTFMGVVQDSRCPEGVTCIWQGEAVVALQVDGEGIEPTTVQLTTSDRGANHLSVDVFCLELAGVTPYPTSTSAIAPSDYRAELKVGPASDCPTDAARASSGPPPG